MSTIKDLNQFKESVSTLFDKYDPEKRPKGTLKAYLIESNIRDPPPLTKTSEWKSLGGTWHITNVKGADYVLNKTNERIWTIYTTDVVNNTEDIIKKWSNSRGLDRCWFSGEYLNRFGKEQGWEERGTGIKYKRSLSQDDNKSGFSLKTWHGTDVDDEIQDLFSKAKEKFTTTSIRWKSKEFENHEITSEWYNYGKITIQYSNNVTELFDIIENMVTTYHTSLLEAEKYRDQNRSSFEFTFKNTIALDDYTNSLKSGKNNLKLWMYETKKEKDFRRYAGVDLHTGDRILLDIGENYAYMSIPGKGCVNAAPRFIAINGENALGRVRAYYEGDEIFV